MECPDNKLLAGLKKAVAAALPFVEKRRKPNGGFGATPKLPATIEDTFYGLEIMALARSLGLAPDEAATDYTALAGWLADLRRSARPGLPTIFRLLASCRRVGMAVAADQRLLAAIIVKTQNATFLGDWQAGAQILREFFPADGSPRKLLGDDFPARISRQPWRGVDEVWMRLSLAEVLTAPTLIPVNLPAWLRACQNGDGGFGFMPGTTSFIENCAYCLRALAALDAEPSDPLGAWQFLAACQTGAGGFSRNGRAAPFLDATWHGLTSLALLCPNDPPAYPDF